MKIRKIIIVSFSLLLFAIASFAQDKRTTETKVADLLARFPANDLSIYRQADGRYAFTWRDRV